MRHRAATGRPRDEALDRLIVDAAAEILKEDGVDGITFVRVAERAGTSRPAIYRRFDSSTDLIVAAVRRIADDESPAPTGHHLDDLVAELRAFRTAIDRANSLTLVGSMLAEHADAAALRAYRELIVRPRRARLGDILTAARDEGLLSGSPPDIELATTMCTGSYYAWALTGRRPPRDWAERTAQMVWRACGG